MIYLEDLTPTTCRWPTNRKDNKHRFCGAAKEADPKRPYCTRHHKIAYQRSVYGKQEAAHVG